MEDALNMLKPIIETANSHLTENPGDYRNEDGLLVCGKCNQPKQTFISLPAVGGPERKLKVRCTCKCDIEEMEREKEEQRQRAARHANPESAGRFTHGVRPSSG